MFYYRLKDDEFTKMLTEVEFGESEPSFDRELFGTNPRMGLIESDTSFFEDKVLVIVKETGSWCFLEPSEYYWYKSLDGNSLENALVDFSHHYKPQLRDMVAWLYWLGLLQVNGRRFLEAHVFDKGPIVCDGDLFAIVPTEKCNLACKYCYADSRPARQERLKWEVAKKIVDLIIQHPGQRANLDLTGGEVLLEIDLIEKIVGYAREQATASGKDIYLWAQTNGTLLTPTVLSRIRDMNIGLAMSLDGDKATNDSTRVFPGNEGTYDSITRGISMLSQMDSPPGVICIVSRYNFHKLTQILEHFREIGIRGIKINPGPKIGRARNNWDSISIELHEFVEAHLSYLQAVENGDCDVVDENISHMLDNLGSRVHTYRCMRSQCGAGKSFMTFSTNGDIHACCRRRNDPRFRLGNVQGLESLNDLWKTNSIMSQLVNRRVSDIAKCRECLYQRFCEGGCSIDSYIHTESPMR